ncbi:hypothetical protein ABIF63_004865 [Bradyrhizobium japonicum]|uniref:Transposase n=1 Tax=Bradyrhizobium japonicum TaxID=375 RepID=A0ABV2RX18_BRAJP|nr:hypothetical protein [Bradyrhizobium japonicum]UQD96023.1 hypothetical protein JEY30_31245 [Bradyrhizobium japonicum]WLB16160.1 hypothetical protein QIH95_29450 [Bradyrhizobium japonicum]
MALDWAKPTAANLHFLQRNGTKTLFQDPLHFHKIDVSYKESPPKRGFFCFRDLWLSIIAICFAGPALAGQARGMTLGVWQRSCGQFIAAVGQAPLGATDLQIWLWQFRALQENVNRRRLAIGAPLSRRRLNVRYVF